VQLWRDTTDPAAMRRIIDTMDVAWPPGTHFQYRDENMILLADVIERVSGEPLDRFAARRIFAALDMEDSRFNPPPRLRPRIAPTERDTIWRHRLLRGEVHDENAFALGGVAGHAGLFSTAADLSHFAQMMLNGGTWRGRRLVTRATIDAFATPQPLPPGTSRALGWDTPGATKGFAGTLASPSAIMHTGFTGTSLYIDRARGAYVILLTNRVNPTRDNRLIGEARRDIHTAVLAALDGRGLAAPH
jgi:serine-type D-Ala-D-Ala carboxypeptidase